MSLPHRLRLLITEKKISQSEFARMLDVTRGSVNQWLAGKLEPGQKPLMRLFELFPEISADWLLLGRGEMTRTGKPDPGIEFLQRQISDAHDKMDMYKKLIDEKDARIRLMERLLEKEEKNNFQDNK